MKRLDRIAVAKRVEWQGGVLAALSYGLYSDDIGDPKLAELWRDAEQHYSQLTPVIRRITRLLWEAEESRLERASLRIIPPTKA